jgi:SSS family solute:Na+ symporter
MFWKRMTAPAALWGLVAGTLAAGITFIGYKVGWFSFSTDLNESMVGAILAFVIDAIVTVVVTLMTRPKPVEQLQGLVYGMANVDESAARRRWWESPGLLGATTLAGAAILTVIFW